MMHVILQIIFFAIIIFDIFMVTPLGVMWLLKDYDNHKCCRGIIIIFIMTPVAMIIGEILGYI